MGLPLQKESFSDHLPNSDEIDSARALVALLEPMSARSAPAHVEVTHAGASESFDLSPGVARMLVEVLRHFAAGRTVTLVPIGGMLTSQQAADLLNVSRPFLIKMIDQGELSAERVGRHRRLDAAEVLAFKRRRERARAEALDALRADDADFI